MKIILFILLFCLSEVCYSSKHLAQECNEGAEMIGHAAESRDAKKTTKEEYLGQMILDLQLIKVFPAETRWFSHDQADEVLLIKHASDVFDKPKKPVEHQVDFLKECFDTK